METRTFGKKGSFYLIVAAATCVSLTFSLAAEGRDLTTKLLTGKGSTKKGSIYDSSFKTGKSSGSRQELKPGRWQREDVSRIFPELRILDDLSSRQSLRKLRKVVLHYNYATARLRAAEGQVEYRKTKWASERHRYAWMAMDRRKQQAKIKARIRAKYRTRAVGDLVKAMRIMQTIRNPRVVKSSRYVELKSKVYVQYVKLQFRSGNLGLIIPVLEQYLTLKPDHKNDPEPHRLLAAGYRHQERIAGRMRNREAQLFFRQKKNTHLEKFVVLKYGQTSPEYKEIKQQINRDQTRLP